MLLGFLLASLTLLLDLPVRPASARALTTVLLVGVPLFDVTLVVAARVRAGRPVWHGGADHASHRLLAIGRSPREIVVLAAVVQGVCSMVGLSVYGASTAVVLAVGVAVAMAWLAGLRWFLRLPEAAPARRASG
jgi:hypothetical protein